MDLTREEMIAMAAKTRTQVMNARVSPELLERYPAVVAKRLIPTEAGDSPVYDILPEGGRPQNSRLIINLHGGGFIRERTPNDEVFCRAMSGRTGSRILDVDYRLVPENPFPAALMESWGVYLWAQQHARELGCDPARIILMGHSAGGNLACGCTFLARRNGCLPPLRLVLDYPPLDLWMDPGDKKPMGKGIPPERARLYNLYYCDRSRQQDPLVSPIYAQDEDLAGFPGTLVLSAGLDDLCHEAEDFALRLIRNGAAVTARRFVHSGHGFTVYRREEYEQAWDMIGQFICAE